MTELSNSQSNDWVGQIQEGTQVIEQPTQEEVVPKKDYISLQSESTKWRQGQIEIAKRLVEKDRAELLNISDPKVRDSVVKELFGYQSLDEMRAIEWDDYISWAQAEDDDKVANLEKQVRILSYQNQTKELEKAISDYKKSNPELFRGETDEIALRDKLKLISGIVDTEERVKMAGTLAFSAATNPTIAAYKTLATSQVSGNSAASATAATKTNADKNSEAIKSFLFK